MSILRLLSMMVAAASVLAAPSAGAADDFLPWSKHSLTWCYLPDGAPAPYTSRKLVEGTIHEALALWSHAANLMFDQATSCASSNPPEITFRWVDDLDGLAIGVTETSILTQSVSVASGDVTRRQLGMPIREQAVIKLSRIKFMKGEGRDPFPALPSIDSARSWLRAVLVHETGHAIGLEHSTDPASVMWPASFPWETLSTGDIAAARALYGTPKPQEQAETVTSNETIGTTAMFVTAVHGNGEAAVSIDDDPRSFLFFHISGATQVSVFEVRIVDGAGRIRLNAHYDGRIVLTVCSEQKCSGTVPIAPEQRIVNVLRPVTISLYADGAAVAQTVMKDANPR